MKKFLLCAAAALALAGAAFAQTTTVLPIQIPYNSWTDLGAGPIKIKVVGTNGIMLIANAANCTGLAAPSAQQGSMPLNKVDEPAVFYTTYHVCASGLVTGTQVLIFATTVVSP